MTERPVQMSASRAVPVRPWVLCAVALLVGLAGGALTSFGQSVLPHGWSALANSASTWVVIAFLAGLRADRRWPWAAGAGALSQLGLVVGYYATSEVRGFAADTGSVVIWIVAGAVAGPVYGAAGALLRHGRRAVRTAAAGVTGSVWALEGIAFLALATSSDGGPGTTAGWCYLVVGIGLPLALTRGVRDRACALLVLAAGTGAAGIATYFLEEAFKR
ncbi:DUF6518 family protein [Kitasatospora sp. RB6PN24]|uniref:DUF6518 family protein n=1 Tax=Kitasatospora humi TaxID=2893891 RepID=UPI001E2CD208|nr:DUF6518 family protein [Kitasatospora humi]MCC9306287.1 DUF6518 family protein [Kitasatospora humi]